MAAGCCCNSIRYRFSFVSSRLDLMKCVVVWCSVWQCAAVCGSVWQCVAVCGSVLRCVAVCGGVWQCVAQCVAVCCSVLQCVAVCCSVFSMCCSVAVYCSVLQSVFPVSCSVLHSRLRPALLQSITVEHTSSIPHLPQLPVVLAAASRRILKHQFVTRFTIKNDCIADLGECLPVVAAADCTCSSIK